MPQPLVTLRLHTPTLNADHRLGEIAARAFVNDDLFGQFLYPHRCEYWAEYAEAWREFVGEARAEGGVIVAAFVGAKGVVNPQEAEEGSETEKVVGWAVWNEIGGEGKPQHEDGMERLPGKAAEKAEDKREEKDDRIVESLPTLDHPSKPVNPASDPAALHAFESAKAYTTHIWSGPYAHVYNLELIAVDPDYQGIGAGRKLIGWGIERAERMARLDDENLEERENSVMGEGIPTSLIAVKGKDEYYGKLGFVERGRADVGPLQGKIEGGAVMFRERGEWKD